MTLPIVTFSWNEGDVRFPGLTPAAGRIRELLHDVPRRLGVYGYKRSGALLWVVFLGGTGTGKSTVFNAFCEKDLSAVGVERPKTLGPILYVHREAAVEVGFPFRDMAVRRLPALDIPPGGLGGDAGRIILLEHDREDLVHVVLVDTPDLDSVELANRRMVEDLALLADVVVFITSQEKYADDVPFQFLRKIRGESKPRLVVLNKAEEALDPDDVQTTLIIERGMRAAALSGGAEVSFFDSPFGGGEALPVSRALAEKVGVSGNESERFHALPYIPAQTVLTAKRLAEEKAFQGFAADLRRTIARPQAARLMEEERERSRRGLARDVKHLMELLEEERKTASAWVDHLDVFFRTSCESLLQEQEERFREESREALQNQIRKHFSKYDLLRTPRQMVAQVIRVPLTLMGLVSEPKEETHEDLVRKVRNQLNLSSVLGAVESFNRQVLEKLMPQDESSLLGQRLRDPALLLTRRDIEGTVWQEEEKVVIWLEKTFHEMARGIPKSKEWGIYSTSILWGGLILALETAVGGGIHLLEAVLDTAIAPFVTKGAVELFAYHELQRIARELGVRTREALTSALRVQRDRFGACVLSLEPSGETLDHMRKLANSLGG